MEFLFFLVLWCGYRWYGTFLKRFLDIDDTRPAPAVTTRDDSDFIPTRSSYLLGQHFSAIAAAGPLVGPILAGLMFGWLPALLWILVGAVFVGGVHDVTTLVASIRHRARSIACLVEEYMSRRAYLLFLVFVWFALVYIIVAFTDITASSFVGNQRLDDGTEVRGGGIASASLLYLLLPIAMGFLMRTTRIPAFVLSLIFVPLTVWAIWIGQRMPLESEALLSLSSSDARTFWSGVILAYCGLAAVSPLWMILQPRGHLGGIFLYGFLCIGVWGVLCGGATIEFPAFLGFSSQGGEPLAPILFITIACGAVSGFHALVASGTTSKQISKESDALPVGYGAMLLEAGVAFLALSCVMMLVPGAPLTAASPNLVFALGLGGFAEQMGISKVFAVSFMLMAFTTFVYDTLDVCTRLGRYIVEELTGLRGGLGKCIGTVVTLLFPLWFIVDSRGETAAWKVFWPLFGASNQLLAALALIFVTVWLGKEKPERRFQVFLVTGIPALFMFCMSVWALCRILFLGIDGDLGNAVFSVSLLILIMSLVMASESITAIIRGQSQRV